MATMFLASIFIAYIGLGISNTLNSAAARIALG